MIPKEQIELLIRLDERSKQTLDIAKENKSAIDKLPSKDTVAVQIHTAIEAHESDCHTRPTAALKSAIPAKVVIALAGAITALTGILAALIA